MSEYITVRADAIQIEKLAKLGVLSAEQLAAGRQAGGLEVRLPAAQVQNFLKPSQTLNELALRIHKAGLTDAARLFVAAGRPLSFFGSQLLLLAQPISKLAFGQKDPLGHYSHLLEDRHNVDLLLTELDNLSKK